MGSKTKTSKPNNKRTSGYQGVIGPQREIKAPLEWDLVNPWLW